MDNPSVLYQLLASAGAVALIYEPSYQSCIVNSPIPTFSTGEDILSLSINQLQLPVLAPKADDVIMIFHTSGSTSGSPKLVPLTAKWLDFTIGKLRHVVPNRMPHGIQQVAVAV